MSTSTDQAQDSQRTKHEAHLDVLYGMELNDMNERFYRRLDGIFSFITILGGSGAFAAFIAGHPATAGYVGLVIAIFGYIDREMRPAQKAEKCAQQRRKFGKLAATTHSLSLEQIDQKLRLLQSNGPATISALAMPAHRQNLSSNGYPTDHLEISGWSKFVSFLI